VNEEIGLPDLIYQIKNELLARRPVEEAKGLPALFWIDQIELELAVTVTRERGGTIKLSVIPAGAELSGSRAEERAHTVKVRLTPFLSREEMRSLLSRDPQVQETLEHFSRASLARELEEESI
jgi:hypothetical protein